MLSANWLFLLLSIIEVLVSVLLQKNGNILGTTTHFFDQAWSEVNVNHSHKALRKFQGGLTLSETVVIGNATVPSNISFSQKGHPVT